MVLILDMLKLQRYPLGEICISDRESGGDLA